MFTYDDRVVRDLYKDAYGFRPSLDWDANYRAATPAQRQAIWDRLLKEFDETQLLEFKSNMRMQKNFEAYIEAAIRTGAADRKVAIRWWLQNFDRDTLVDVDYFLYTVGYSENKVIADEIKEVLAG